MKLIVRSGQLLFWVDCWHICIWRNKVIFEDDFQRPFNAISIVLEMVEDINNCNHCPMNIRLEDAIFIGWERPREWWAKLNCDGAYEDTQMIIRCGGLTRHFYGRWLIVYSRKIGTWDTLSAKMWGCTWVCSLLGDVVSVVFKL